MATALPFRFLCALWNKTPSFEFASRNVREGRAVQGAAIAILVVEDDQLVRGMVADALSDGSFEAHVATSGEEAVNLLADETRYRALITDINLHGALDGWKVGHRARELNPDIPVIYPPAQIVAAVAQLLNTTSMPPS